MLYYLISIIATMNIAIRKANNNTNLHKIEFNIERNIFKPARWLYRGKVEIRSYIDKSCGLIFSTSDLYFKRDYDKEHNSEEYAIYIAEGSFKIIDCNKIFICIILKEFPNELYYTIVDLSVIDLSSICHYKTFVMSAKEYNLYKKYGIFTPEKDVRIEHYKNNRKNLPPYAFKRPFYCQNSNEKAGDFHQNEDAESDEISQKDDYDYEKPQTRLYIIFVSTVITIFILYELFNKYRRFL